MENIDPIHIPEDVLGEILFKMKIEDILRLENTSKNWKYVIDKLWCRLLERDFKVKSKDKCDTKYKELYEINLLVITEKQIESSIKKYKSSLSLNDITSILESKDFEKIKDGWMYIPKILGHPILHEFFDEFIFLKGDIVDSNLLNISSNIEKLIYYQHINKIDEYKAYEILRNIFPKRYIFDDNENSRILDIYIPFDLFIKGYNYLNDNRFDEDFIKEAISYLSKPRVIEGRRINLIKIEQLKNRKVDEPTIIKLKKSSNPQLDAENMLKKFHQVANY